MNRTRFGLLQVVLMLALAGCGGGDDSSPIDSGPEDAPDSAPPDSSDVDAGSCIATAEDFPEPVTGHCEVTVNEGADLPAGEDGAGGIITPGGRRVSQVGRVVDLSGFPMSFAEVPETDFLIVSDGAIYTEFLRVVNRVTGEVESEVSFDDESGALFLGIAMSPDGSRVWASGGGANRIYAFDLNTETGEITRNEDGDLSTSGSATQGYFSGIALLPDGHTLVANLLIASDLVFYDVDTQEETDRVALEDSSLPYDIVVSDDGTRAFISLWNTGEVLPVNLEDHTLLDPITVGKNPERLAMSSDGMKIAVANADSDSLSIIDVGTMTATTTIDISGESMPRGSSPAAVDFGPNGRLYVVSAGDNAIDVFEPADSSYSRVGRIPTLWYPTDVLAFEDGTVAFLNGKGNGSGPNDDPEEDSILNLMAGNMTIVDAEDIDDGQLASWETEIATNNERARLFETLDCGDEETSDFPIPREGEGASTKIEHVILVIRENKTYDAYLGDLQDSEGNPHGNGDPNLTIIPNDEIGQVIPNTLELARDFAIGDNYYSGAEQSIQGHIWTIYGRTTDFVERTWLTTWGRAYWGVPPQSVRTPVGVPEEGSGMSYLIENGVEVRNYGEVLATSTGVPLAAGYPGLVYTLGVQDADKADFIREVVQDDCDLAQFTYVVMPQDHTYGLDPNMPTPASMIASNDQGVGMLVDAVAHSSFWPSTVIFIIEDDPQDGGDHVDNHRSPLLVVSPWAKRGYVSSVHYNESSIYRTIQLILGVEEPLNAYWANASPMYDMFTATPDYTPYDNIERLWPVELNPDDGSRMARRSARYNWNVPDEQPGLSDMLWEHFHSRAWLNHARRVRK